MARITLTDEYKGFSGRIDDAVIYSWRGITCMRSYVVPRNPDTAAQRERRRRFAAAVQCWKSLSAETKERWNSIKADKRLTGYNVFVSAYMRCDTVPLLSAAHPARPYVDFSSPLRPTLSASFPPLPEKAVVLSFPPHDTHELALSG